MSTADKIEQKMLTILKWGTAILGTLSLISILDKKVKDAKKGVEFIEGVGRINPNRIGTRVIFKKFPNGEIIAFFPDIIEKRNGWGTPIECLSYVHMGQHGAASYDLIRELKPAKQSEYAPLLRELKQIGYGDLIISHRV